MHADFAQLLKTDFVESVALRKLEVESFVFPPFDSADHLLHGSPEFSELERGTVGTVAVWAGAVDDEERVDRIVRQVALHDSTVGQVDRRWETPRLVEIRAPDVEENEVGGACLDTVVDVPAVGFESE